MAASTYRTSEIGRRKPTEKSRRARDFAADWKRWSPTERIIAASLAVLWIATESSLVILKGLWGRSLF